MNPSNFKKYLKINDKTMLHEHYQTITVFNYSYYKFSWPRGLNGTNQFNNGTNLGMLNRNGVLNIKL